MEPILAGIETEYGLSIEGKGADSQVEDSMALVRSYPGERHLGWNYRYESPRADLRGFVLDHLAEDPEDRQFDRNTPSIPVQELRADHILANGARFYNDHGHPEYSTPECWSINGLAAHDKEGERQVLSAAQAYEEAIGRRVKVYKNNTDYHGASYGTHESYLVPRSLGYEKLYAAVTPMLIARQILCGAGKVGSEEGSWCDFQLSQRADFFVEPANAETLYRRPIFNTRDEPHANPRDWIRLHVISGDANRMPSCTARKVGLVKMALHLAKIGEAPVWRISEPVRTFKRISRDRELKFIIDLEAGSWTTAYGVIESYCAAFETHFGLGVSPEFDSLIAEVRGLLADLPTLGALSRRNIDWLAKMTMLEGYAIEEECEWRDPMMQSLDLEYHRVDSEESLYDALLEMGEIDAEPPSQFTPEHTRAYARSLAIKKFGQYLVRAGWASLTFDLNGKETEVLLDPSCEYGPELDAAKDVGEFIEMLGGQR